MSVCAVLFVCPDTKNTQWEDPRLQSPAITGPVSSFSDATLVLTPPGAVYLPPSPGVSVRHGQTALSPPLNMPTPLCRYMCGRTTVHIRLTLSRSRSSEARLCSFALRRSSLDPFVLAGRSVLQGVQAEIRLLQEEVKETGKDRLVCLGCWDLVKMSRHPSSRWLEARLP